MCCKLLAYSKKEKGPISAPRSTFWLWLARSSKDPRLNGFSGHVSGIPCDTHLFWEMLQNLWLCLVSCFAHLLPILDCWEMRCKKLASSVPNTCGFSWLWSRTDLIQRPAFQHVQNFKLKQMLRPKWVSFWPFSKVYKERIVEHVLLLVSAKRIAELLFQEPQRTRTTITQVHRY